MELSPTFDRILFFTTHAMNLKYEGYMVKAHRVCLQGTIASMEVESTGVEKVQYVLAARSLEGVPMMKEGKSSCI